MARQVFRGSAARMTAVSRAVLVAVMASVLVIGEPARASAVIGATEPTQIMNNIQLVASYAKQLEQVQYAIQSVAALKQQLVQLNPSTLSGISQQSLNDLRSLSDLGNSVQNAVASSRNSLEVLQRNQLNMDLTRLTPSEYLAQRAQIAQSSTSAEAAQYKSDQQTLQQLQDDSAEVDRAASAAGGVTSNIQGFQQMIASNNRVQAQMISMNGAVARANMVAAQRAQSQDAAKLMDQTATTTYMTNQQQGMQQAQQRTVTVPSTANYADPNQK